jgi:hypothetical protein
MSWSLSPSASVSPSVSASWSISPSASASASPSAGYQLYSRGKYADIPGDDNDLETMYSAGDVAKVASKDDDRVPQTGLQQYMIHEFKDFVGAYTSCTLECELQTTELPSSAPVNLDIYNHTLSQWDNVKSDNTSPIDTDFILTTNVPDLTAYKDGSNIISCRVWQQAI